MHGLLTWVQHSTLLDTGACVPARVPARLRAQLQRNNTVLRCAATMELDHQLIQSNFIASTLLFKWKQYVIRCAINCDGLDRRKKTWPFVFGMGEWQWVNSAMWDVSGASPKLVAAWVFSPSGDETNLLHLAEYADDVFAFHEAATGREKQFPLPACCAPHDAFSCSSGDDAVPSFRCPALEDPAIMTLQVLMMDTRYEEEPQQGSGKRPIPPRKLYEERSDEEEEGEEEEQQEQEEEEGGAEKQPEAKGATGGSSAEF